MKLRKKLLVLGILTSFVLFVPIHQTWATNPASDEAIIVGPEYWGVVVIQCTTRVVTLRVKRIEDCDVDTQAFTKKYTTSICDQEITEEIILHQWLNMKLFNETGVPIVTKVKNLKKETLTGPAPGYVGDLYSADVQIRFCTTCQ